MSANYGNRGIILLEMGRLDEAFKDFEKQAEMGDPDKAVGALKEVTPKYVESGNYSDLLRVYEKAEELDPENLDTLSGLCGAYKMLNREDDFERTIEKIVGIAMRSKDVGEID